MAELARRLENLPVELPKLQRWILEQKAELGKRIKVLKQQGFLKPHYNFLYFIQPKDGGLVKIGKTADVQSRLKNLQCGSPVELCLIKTVEIEHAEAWELFWHRLFKPFRIKGEWFDPIVLTLYEGIVNEK